MRAMQRKDLDMVITLTSYRPAPERAGNNSIAGALKRHRRDETNGDPRHRLLSLVEERKRQPLGQPSHHLGVPTWNALASSELKDAVSRLIPFPRPMTAS